MGRRIAFGRPQNDAEVWAFQHLESVLPDEITFLTNIDVLSDAGQPFEIDALVLGPWAVHLIDIKGYFGKVDVGKDLWELDGREVENPLPKANMVARMFASRLRRRSGPDRYVPWCQGGAFMTGTKGEGLSLRRHPRELCAWGPDEIFLALTEHKYVTSSLKHPVSEDQWQLVMDVAGQTEAVMRRESRIGDFERKKRLLKNGGLEIWTAMHRSGTYERPFVLKSVEPSGFDAKGAREARDALLREQALFQRAAGLSGIPYVAPLIDEGDRLTLPIRLPAGRPLDQVLGEVEGTRRRLKILRSIVLALQGLHERGLAHGGLAPASIFVSDNDEVELLDFSIEAQPRDHGDDIDTLRDMFAPWFAEAENESIRAWFSSDRAGLSALRARIARALDPERDAVPVSDAVKIEPGAIVAGHYRLEDRIRESGELSIWRARHTIGRFDCAVTVLEPGGRSLERARARFGQLARLFHPRLTRVFDVDELEDGRWLIARAWVEGASLGSHVADEDAATANHIDQWSREILPALEYLHDCRLVHGNINPWSLVLSDNGLSLIDFAFMDEGPPQNRMENYAPPDPLKGTPAGDLWSTFACMLAAMAGTTEIPLHEDASFSSFVQRHLCDTSDSVLTRVGRFLLTPSDEIAGEYLGRFGISDEESKLTELPEEFRQVWGISKGYMEFLVVDMLNDGRARARRQWVLEALRSRRIAGNKTNYSSFNATMSRLLSAGIAEKYRTKIRLTGRFRRSWEEDGAN